MTETIVDRIYEAAFVPDLWPGVIERIADISGSAAGSVLIMGGPNQPPRYKASAVTEPSLRLHTTSDDWKASRAAQAAARLVVNGVVPAEFLYVADSMSADELAQDSVRRDLLKLGLEAQIGTLVPMLSGELVIYTFERWRQDGRHSPAEVATLNGLRPHLARAALMAARLGLERARSTVSAMEGLGLPAAVLSSSGRVLATNALLEKFPKVFIARAHGGLALATPEADALLHLALAEIPGGIEATRSIPIPGDEERPAMVVHALPLRRAAHDIFPGGDVLIAATEVGLRAEGPPVGILTGLFDLTPAEARIAAALTAGRTLQEAATQQAVQITTARAYLSQLFRKTGTHQQSQLVSLLSGAQPPRAM